MSLDLYQGGVYVGTIDSIDLGAAGISATVASGRAQFRAAPSVHDNNQNTVIQRGPDGNGQNVAYIDSSNMLVVGPGARPDMTILSPSPLNVYKRHWQDDFFGLTLRPEWTVETAGDAGVTLGEGDTYAHLWTGASGGEIELRLEGTRDKVGWGSLLYGFAIMGQSANADIFFGFSSATESAGYERRGSNWYGITSHSGTETVTASIAGLDDWRRMWLVDAGTAGQVSFWRSVDGGLITKRATITTNLPTGYLSPTITLSADGASSLDLDLVYSIRNR